MEGVQQNPTYTFFCPVFYICNPTFFPSYSLSGNVHYGAQLDRAHHHVLILFAVLVQGVPSVDAACETCDHHHPVGPAGDDAGSRLRSPTANLRRQQVHLQTTRRQSRHPDQSIQQLLHTDLHQEEPQSQTKLTTEGGPPSL